MKKLLSDITKKKIDNLEYKIFSTREEMGEVAALEAIAYINEEQKKREELRIIFAAAPSQNEFLANLIEDTSIDWTRIIAFHMDEYIGLSASASQRFGNFLDEKIFKRVPFKKVNYLEGNASNIEEECDRYTKLLTEKQIDIVFLGVGENGHIAFNEPDVADFEDIKMVKKVPLDEICRQQQVNDGCFERISDVPTHALTLTIPMLCSATSMFCIVPSKNKNNAIVQMLTKDISTDCPASILRRHNLAKLYLDKDSAMGI